MTCNPQPAMIQKYVTQMPRRVATNVAMQRRLATKCIFINETRFRALRNLFIEFIARHSLVAGGQSEL